MPVQITPANYARRLVWEWALEGYGWDDIGIMLKQCELYEPPSSFIKTMVLRAAIVNVERAAQVKR